MLANHLGCYRQTPLHTEALTRKSIYTEQRLSTEAWTQRLLSRISSPQRGVYTQMFFAEESLYPRRPSRTESCLTEKPLHRAAFTYSSLYTDQRFHTKAFTHTCIWTCTDTPCAHRSFYTQKLLYTNLLHTEASAKSTVYSQTFLLTNASTNNAFTYKRLHTQKRLHIAAFTYRSFYAEKLLHIAAFSQRDFYTQTPLHTEAFMHRCF